MVHSHFQEWDDAEITQYRSVEPLSVLSVLLAIGSIGTLFDPWIASPLFLAAIAFSLISLLRIKRRPELFLGRKAALFSLGLALFCASGGIARHVTYEYMIRQRAKTVGQEFLELIAQNTPELAFPWTLPPKRRCDAGSDIWAFYRSDEEMAKNLRKFTDRKEIRALLALGTDTKIYPVGRANYNKYSNAEVIDQIYAIDFLSDGKEKTFFFRLRLCHGKPKTEAPQWTVTHYLGGIDPWKEER